MTDDVLPDRGPDPADDPAVRLLRDTLDANASGAPSGAGLAAAVRRRAARGRARTVLAAVAAVAAVTLVATGATLLLGGRGSGQPPTGTTRPSPSPSRPGPAPGWQRISSLGAEVDVPDGWDVVGAVTGCGPLPDAVVVRGGGAVAGCGYTEPAGFTVVEIMSAARLRSDPEPFPLRPGTSPTTQPLNRVPMDLTTSRLADGRSQVVLASTERDVAVVARGPAKALLDRVIGTVTLVDVDAAGCPGVLPPAPSWDRPGRGGGLGLDPKGADAVSVCAYSTDGSTQRPAARLVASTVLEGDDATSLVGLLTGAKKGRSPDEPATDCLRGVPETASLVLGVRHGNNVTPLRVHYDRCTDRYVASPDGVAHATSAQLKAVYSRLGMGWTELGDLG